MFINVISFILRYTVKMTYNNALATTWRILTIKRRALHLNTDSYRRRSSNALFLAKHTSSFIEVKSTCYKDVNKLENNLIECAFSQLSLMNKNKYWITRFSAGESKNVAR